jgi:hypothetical protein
MIFSIQNYRCCYVWLGCVPCIWCRMFFGSVHCILMGSLGISFIICHFHNICLSVMLVLVFFVVVFCVRKSLLSFVSFNKFVIFLASFLLYVPHFVF